MWPHSRVCQVVLALHWSASVPTHRVSHPLVSYTRLQSLVLSGFQMAKVEATRSYKTRLWNSHYVTFATSVGPSQSRGQVRCKGAGEIGSFSSWKLQKSMWTQEGVNHWGTLVYCFPTAAISYRITFHLLAFLSCPQLPFKQVREQCVCYHALYFVTLYLASRSQTGDLCLYY